MRKRVKRPTVLALVAVLALGPAGCLGAPPAGVEARHGRVLAEDVADARLVAAELDDLVPRIAELLPEAVTDPSDVWIVDLETVRRLPGPARAGAKADPRARRVSVCAPVTRPAESEPPGFGRAAAVARRSDLAHELVHVMLGPGWSTLPTRIEEGLADWIASRTVPAGARGLRLNRLVGAYNVSGQELELRLRVHDERLPVLESSPLALIARVSTDRAAQESQRTYSIGFLLASRIIARGGVQHLHALAQRAREQGLAEAPEAWFAEAAGFDPDDPAEVRRAVRLEFEPEELLWLGRRILDAQAPAARTVEIVAVDVHER
jgi:hypothetical protein